MIMIKKLIMSIIIVRYGQSESYATVSLHCMATSGGLMTYS